MHLCIRYQQPHHQEMRNTQMGRGQQLLAKQGEGRGGKNLPPLQITLKTEVKNVHFKDEHSLPQYYCRTCQLLTCCSKYQWFAGMTSVMTMRDLYSDFKCLYSN